MDWRRQHQATHCLPQLARFASFERMRSPLVRVVIGLVAVIFPLVATQWLVRKLPLPRMVVIASAALLGAAVAYLTYRTYVRVVEKRELVEFGRAGAFQESAAGLALGAALFAGAISILALLGAYRLVGAGSVSDVVVPLAVAIMAGVGEEIVFRGLIFRIAEQSLGTFWALGISAALFGLAHLVGPSTSVYAAIAIIFEAGIMLAAAYILTRRLWFCIGMHIAWNFTQSGILVVAVSGPPSRGLLRGTLTGPDWLTGGSFGVEASIVAIVLCMTIAAVLLALAQRRHRFVAPFCRARA
jgi:membrane protease YdiL (CAAX protease family)